MPSAAGQEPPGLARDSGISIVVIKELYLSHTNESRTVVLVDLYNCLFLSFFLPSVFAIGVGVVMLPNKCIDLFVRWVGKILDGKASDFRTKRRRKQQTAKQNYTKKENIRGPKVL